MAVERREKVGVFVGESPLSCEGSIATRASQAVATTSLDSLGLKGQGSGWILLSGHSLVAPMWPQCERT